MSPPRRVAPSTLVVCNFKAPASGTRREVVLAHLARASFACMQRILLLPSVTKAVSYEEIFPRNFGVGGVTNFLGKFRQVHNLKISDRLLRSKSFFQENIPGFICSVFRSA